MALLKVTKHDIEDKLKPDGDNIGVKVGEAAGQSRKHVHIHIIPRFRGGTPDSRGGVRCVLPQRK